MKRNPTQADLCADLERRVSVSAVKTIRRCTALLIAEERERDGETTRYNPAKLPTRPLDLAQYADQLWRGEHTQ